MNKKIIFIAIVILLIIATLFGILYSLKNRETSNKEIQAQTERIVEKKETFVETVKTKVGDVKETIKSDNNTSSLESLVLKTGTIDRKYLLEKPLEKGDVKNLVIALHGGNGNGERLQKTLRLSELATTNQTVIVYLDGVDENWNDIRVKSEDVDDLGFLTELIKTLQSSYGVGKENTTLIGVSNGGFMTQTLVCQNDSLVKNMISIVSSLLVELAEQCKSFPINSIYILGKKDTLVPYQGGSLTSLIAGNVLSAQNTLTNVALINKCGEKSEEKELTNTLVQKITDCPNNGQVSLITYVNESHLSIPLKVDFVSIIRENGIIK
jgi:poly(3-hydroxybutyrate) depolymerase